MNFTRPALRREWIALIAATAVMLQALIPFFAVYQPAQQDMRKLAAFYGDKILLCVQDGFRLVSWEDLVNGKVKPQHHSPYQCALCYVAANGTALEPLPATSFLLLPAVVTAALPAVAETFILTEKSWHARLTRSPPHFLLPA